ncbi:hypothetical protein BJ741DRAFT_350523 [Chytriomyces cf. hyalinus JEL632]|nr:hypothetical protein BJ741DRAFT_350523 [Chytriomyces cf. hyalinus JEL632]
MLCDLFLGTMATGRLAKGSIAMPPQATAPTTIHSETASGTTTTAHTSSSTPAATPVLLGRPAGYVPSAQSSSSTLVAALPADTPTARAENLNSDVNDENSDPWMLEDLPPADDAVCFSQTHAQPTAAVQTLPHTQLLAASAAPLTKAPVYGTKFPTADTPIRKRKDANENTIPVGERPKRSHTASFGSDISALTNNISHILNALTPDPAPPRSLPPPLPLPPVQSDEYANLPPGVQVALAVAKKVNRILILYNGRFNGEECDWLHTRLSYRYNELLESQHRAGSFLGTLSDDASAEFLHHMWKHSICSEKSAAGMGVE